MRRSPARSVVANPVLLGAVTVLVVVVAVFLAYNANNGLPFVPTYRVTATVPDAAKLVAGNEVRIGGALVGRVSSVTPVVRGGRPVARLSLQLDRAVPNLPTDTKVLIRQRSNIGLKYVELRPGRARTTIPDGGAVAYANATAPVDLDQVLGTFDPPTRNALRTIVGELGTGFAGRGPDLNTALAALPGVTDDLVSVGRSLASPRADLDGFVRGTESAAAAVAPVAPALRSLIDAGATTFGALASHRAALGQLIARSPAAEQDATAALGTLQPLLRQATGLAIDAEPGVRRLGTASTALAAALDASGPVLGRNGRLATPLERLVGAARDLARRPATTGALERLIDVVRIGVPLLTYIAPMQTKCNALGLWTRNVPSLASQGDPLGTWFRFVAVTRVDEILPHADRSPNLHYDPLPDTGQNGECESGNATFVQGTQVGPVPGRQPLATEHTVPGSLAQKIAAEEAGR